jgi:hypothetical protein
MSTAMNLDLNDGQLGGESRNGGNVPALEVHQHGGNVKPFSTVHLRQQRDRL